MTNQHNDSNESKKDASDGLRIKTSAWKWYLLGLAILGFVIGIISGLSESPVAATLIPLLFGLISAGSGLYVLKSQLNTKAGFFKLKILSFSLIVLAIFCFSGIIYGISVRTGVSFKSFFPFVKSEVREEGLLYDDPLKNTDMIILRTKLRMAGATDFEIRKIFEKIDGKATGNDSVINKTKDSVFNEAIEKIDKAEKSIEVIVSTKASEIGSDKEILLQENIEGLTDDLFRVRPVLIWLKKNSSDFSNDAEATIQRVTKNMREEILVKRQSLENLSKKAGTDPMVFRDLHDILETLLEISQQSTFVFDDLDKTVEAFIKFIGPDKINTIRQLSTERPTIKH